MSKKESLNPASIAWIFVAVAALWVFIPFAVFTVYPDMPSRGQFGDVFGAVNALFSGLALAGVVIALILQRQQIRTNEEQIEQARKDEEVSRLALQQTVYAQAYKTAMDILQNESVRDARRVVLRDLSQRPLSQWTEQEMKLAEEVCHTYDAVGIMIRKNMLPAEYIADSWGDSLRRSWRILQPLVQRYRDARDSQEYWDDFEWLAAEALKYQKGAPQVISPRSAV